MSKKRNQEASAAADALPWRGRLRSHHSPPCRWSPRLFSRIKNREEEEAQMFKKHASSKNRRPNPRGSGSTEKTRCGCSLGRPEVAPDVRRRSLRGSGSTEKTRCGCSLGRPEVAPDVRRRSLRLAARELEQFFVVHEPKKEDKVKGSQSAITPLRRSPRLHSEINTGDTTLGNYKPLPQKSPGKLLLKKKSHQKPPPLAPNPQEIAPNKEIQNAFGGKSEKKPKLKPKFGEERTRKRKRSIEEKPLPKKKRQQKLQPLPPNPQEVAHKKEIHNVFCAKSEKKTSPELKPEIGEVRARKKERSTEAEDVVIERGGMEPCCGSDEWTEEQDMALRQAYFVARPSPHFWKKVSKMVPGKSAEECFNRIHADLATPTPIAPRSRLSRMKSSPLGNFTLSDPKIPNLLDSKAGRHRSSKQKSLAAQKTVRHLLKKHCLVDRAQEADHFTIFETSPSALRLDISDENSPGTPESFRNSGFLRKCNQSSSAHKKAPSRFMVKQDEPSPAVLKRVKNVVLHEKYIDQFSRREAVKRPRNKASSSIPTGCVQTGSELQTGGGLKAARTALISEATDFISHFRKLQANSLVHFMRCNEEDEDDGIECDTNEYCDDDDQ